MTTLHDLTGDSFGRWMVLARAKTRTSPSGQRRTYWLCKCSCGQVREVLASMLTTAGSVSCGCHRAEVAGRLNRGRRKFIVGYYPAHRRVDRQRGRARNHDCADCGAPAAEWSYDRTDPDELVSPRGLTYSVKPEHYSPRCITCHRIFDRDVRVTDA